MNISITLDYELFLGAKTGTVSKCLVEPLNALEATVKDSDNVRFTIFVDTTYLYKIYQLKERVPSLAADYDQLVEHITELKSHGHDIQLHIHPHWQYSDYIDGRWKLDHEHYKLSDLQPGEASMIVKNAKQQLDSILGYSTSIFRAGGFSAQPTSLIVKLFAENGIVADSSVCPGTSYDSPQQKYDYTSAPHVDKYKFSRDICEPDSMGGNFLEIPFTMYRVSPLFHWKLAFNRMLPSKDEHKKMGDGISVKTTGDSIVKRLTEFYDCPATIDGYKAKFLINAYRKAKKDGLNQFTVLGHPKLATPYSVKMMGQFVARAIAAGDKFVTLSEVIDEH